MGGMGKTTIAKYVYNLHFERFEGSSFLANIREVSAQPNGLIHLQKQLLSEILKGKCVKIWNVDEGITKIKDNIGFKRVLIVLDDVDDQLNKILPARDWFHPGSKIIITTRQKQLLKAHDIYKVHEVKKLDSKETFRLFNLHAFGQDEPVERHVEQSRKVAHYCGGMPLALEVMGSCLSGKSVDVWESALKRIEVIPKNKILQVLRISYDSLPDIRCKNLFLDIVCFFVGKDKDDVITILDGCGYATTYGLQTLMDRFLLTANENETLEMHQLLQDMGREIIHEESYDEPGKHSRLWRRKDVLDVLREKTGTEKIKGLILNLFVDKPAQTFSSPSDGNRQHSEDFLDGSIVRSGNPFKRRRIDNFSGILSSLTTLLTKIKSGEESFHTASFSGMGNLRLLQLYNVPLIGSYKEFPKKLVWLFWHGFPARSIPNDFALESLVVLEMPCSSLEQVWEKTKLLRYLKTLNLSHSHCLYKTPDFLAVPNLERIILEDCTNLVEVHESIGELRRLAVLNLSGCKNIRKLPEKIGNQHFLKELNLSGCSKLKELPAELEKMEYLKYLNLDGLNLSYSKTAEVIPWHAIWTRVYKLTKSPEISVGSLPQSLAKLSLIGCNIDDNSFPKDLSSLHSLQFLDLSENPICTLPESIKDLTKLTELILEDCRKLQSLPELPMSVDFLYVRRCKSLEMVTNLPNLLLPHKYRHFDFVGCEKLDEVKGLYKLDSVGNFDAEILENLGLVKLESIKSLKVKLWNRMTDTIKFYPLQGLHEFGIFNIFLRGSVVPEWFRTNKKMGFSRHFFDSGVPNRVPGKHSSMWSSTSFRVPSVLDLKICGLNVCVVYSSEFPSPDFMGLDILNLFRIVVCNATQELDWCYCPTFLGVPDDDTDTHMTWLSHWKFESGQLEAEDDVYVEVYHNFAVNPYVEIQSVYDTEKQGTQQNTPHDTYGSAIDVLQYKPKPHFYLRLFSELLESD